MMQTDVGPGNSVHLNMLNLSVEPKNAESVTVLNVAGATLNYYTNTCSSPAGTIAAAASQTFTLPVWLQSQGPRSTIRVTGGKFGN